MTPEEARTALLDQFPDFQAPELDAEDLEDPYLVFGRLGLAGWVEALMRDFAREETLRRVFTFIEQLLDKGSRDVRSLVATAFLEALARPTGEGDPPSVSRAAHYMGPKTGYLFGEMQAFWTGTLDAFHATTNNPWANDDLLPMFT